MALVKLAGGVELDLATGDELRNGVTKPLDSLLNRTDPKPLFLQRPGSVTGTGSGTSTVVVGSPPAGRIWNVRTLTVVCNDDHSLPSGAARNVSLYFGDPFNPTLASLQLVKVPIPSTNFASADALWCPAGLQLFCVTDAALATTDELIVIVNVSEWRVSDIMDGTGRP